ncbi:LexA family protein [Desulfoluna spongiiphila]|uniref:LexA family protein n=1 Tax=Desulfoluna spongiiphila TaxID=419481 RepID=UPI001255D2F1|nr:translesion error-prone DNA polymerase V autoproteolytic subunit [Desulfoluna spongiiphila]VVS90796.1 peptidase s24/s26a/s26b/s26c [Desulfoluna spongiiphila]
MTTVTFDPDGSMDLNEVLIKHPAYTFFMRAAGNSMTGAGIYPGDILVVDRSLEATDKKVIIAIVNGDLTVKRLRLKDGRAFLVAENEGYAPIEITGHMECGVW